MRSGDVVFVRFGARPLPEESLEDVMATGLPGDVLEWKRWDDAMSRPERVSEMRWVVDAVLDEGVVSVCLDFDPREEFSSGEFCSYVDEGDVIV